MNAYVTDEGLPPAVISDLLPLLVRESPHPGAAAADRAGVLDRQGAVWQ